MEFGYDARTQELQAQVSAFMTEFVYPAEHEFEAALAMSPKDIAANRALGVFYLATDRASDAEPKLKTVAAESKKSTDRFILADYYLSTDRFDEAKTLLQELAATDRGSFAAATIRLSAIAARGGDAAGARTLIDEVLQKQPTNVDALVARANLLLRDQKFDQALAPAEEAVKADTRSVSARYVLARVHGARQDWDDAVASYNEVLRLDPRVNAARLEVARLSLARG